MERPRAVGYALGRWVLVAEEQRASNQWRISASPEIIHLEHTTGVVVRPMEDSEVTELR